MSLVEPIHPDPGCETITGVVLDDDRILLDLGASPRPGQASLDVVASFFTPDALMRVTGVLVQADEDGGQFELITKDVDRVQRRATQRIDIDLPCSLLAMDDAGATRPVRGHTRNVSAGGCRVVTERPFATGTEPTISFDLDGGPVVAEAFVLDCVHADDGWDYRLMFTAIDDADRERLVALAA